MPEKVRLFLFHIIFVFTALAPGWLVTYAHHDQYRYFREGFGDPDFKSHCYNDLQNGHLILLGRPLAAKLECTIFWNIDQRSQLMWFRIVVLLFLASIGTVLSLYAIQLGLPPLWAFALGAGTALLPGGLNALTMTNMPSSLTALLAISAGVLALGRGQAPPSWGKTVFSFVLLGLSFFLYSPLTPIFFFPFFLFILFKDSKLELSTVWRKLGLTLILFAANSAVFMWFGRMKFKALSPDRLASMPAAYHVKVDFANVGRQIVNLVTEKLPMEFRLWDVNLEVGGPYIFVFLFFLGLAIFARQKSWLDMLLLFGTFLVLNLTFILTPALFLFRVAWAGQTALVGIVIWLLYQKQNRLVGSAIIIALFSLTLRTQSLVVLNETTEFQRLKDQLKIGLAQQIPTQIFFVPTTGLEVGFNGKVGITDEFNVPSSHFGKAQIGYMIQIAMRELGFKDIYVINEEADLKAFKDQLTASVQVDASPDYLAVTTGTGFQFQLENRTKRVRLTDWSIDGFVNESQNKIDWNDLGQWHKTSGPEGSLSGSWSISTWLTKAIPLTLIEPGTQAPKQTDLLTLDMHQALLRGQNP